MKKEILLTLPLAALLAMPVAAQQAPQSSSTPATSSSSDQQAPAPASQTTDQAQSSDQKQSASERQPLTYESRQGFWGKINPFARKKYVQKQLDPVRGRVNELDELTAQNAKMIKDVDSRAQQGILLASNRANEADQHAVEAGNRAQLAHQTATQATQRLQSVETAVTNIDQYKPVTDAEIRFRPGQLVLSKKAKSALDEMVEPLKNQKGYIIEVQGFSSGRGQAALENSQRMAESVVRYLVLNNEIPVYRIYTIGMGNAPVQATGSGKAHRTTGGRVEIAVPKNGAGDLETNAMNAQPSSAPANNAAPNGSAPSNDMNNNNAAPPSSPIGAGNAAPADSTSQQPASSEPASNQSAQPAQPSPR